MPIIKRIQPIPQPRRCSTVEQDQAKRRKKLTLAEIGIVLAAGVSGLAGLFLLAWLVLPHSGKILPFMVESALPLFTLFAVIYQAVVYRRQWDVMQRALKQTETVIGKMQAQLFVIQRQAEAMEKSVVETQKLVAHSETSIKVAEQNMVYAQRAYIAIVGKSFTGAGFNLIVENSGNTPALDVAINAIVRAGTSPPELESGDIEAYKNIGLLAPGAQHPYKLERQLSEEEKAEFANQFTGPLCCWWITGYIVYRDIFQAEPSNDEPRDHYEPRDYHLTEFCFCLGKNTQGVEAHSRGNRIKEYRKGQETKWKPN